MTTNPAVAAALRRLDIAPFYTPSEVAALFRVDTKTVARWAKSGKLVHSRTIGGHRRYPADLIDALLRAEAQAEPE